MALHYLHLQRVWESSRALAAAESNLVCVTSEALSEASEQDAPRIAKEIHQILVGSGIDPTRVIAQVALFDSLFAD